MEELTDRQKAIRQGMSGVEIRVRNALSRAYVNIAPILRQAGVEMPVNPDGINAFAGLPAFEFAASQHSHSMMAALEGACARALKEQSLSKDDLALLLRRRGDACQYIRELNKEIRRYRETLAALNAFNDNRPSDQGGFSC